MSVVLGPDERRQSVAAAFRTGAQSYGAFGAALYSALCAAGADDPEIVDLATQAQAGAQPVFHLLTAVHCLVLADPNDPLAAYFPTLREKPLPANEAWPAFKRFCQLRREDIVSTLAASTVQTTFAERCTGLLPALSWVAEQAGEPLNLIEIGCSAGVLLALDKYGYSYNGAEPFGHPDAPLMLSAEMSGDPPRRIPLIGSRIGLDLNPLDARDANDRRWLIAQVFPEFTRQREDLTKALDLVAQTDLHMVRGDALKTLGDVLARTTDPVCLFHSVCLSYWSEEARQALDALLARASKGRTLYRVGSEPSAQFSAWNKGHDRKTQERPPAGGEIVIARYHDGAMEARIVGKTLFGGPLEWFGWDGAMTSN
jgi:hypothetical protein